MAVIGKNSKATLKAKVTIHGIRYMLGEDHKLQCPECQSEAIGWNIREFNIRGETEKQVIMCDCKTCGCVFEIDWEAKC